MPSKKVTYCPRGKPVLVTVYVEKPTRRAASHGHHPYVHHTIKREVVQYRNGPGGQGFISRRAELLQYSQRLRLSARSAAAASNPSYAKPNHAKSNPQPPAKVAAARRKPKNSTWSIFGMCTSNFQDARERKTRKKRSGSTTSSSRIKSAMNSLKGQKKQGFFSKLFSAFSKRK